MAIAVISGVGLFLFGRKERIIRVDPSTKPFYILVEPSKSESQLFLAALLPGINDMYLATDELHQQNVWLIKNLNRCLAKLESERGLRPIELRDGQFKSPVTPDGNAFVSQKLLLGPDDPLEPWYLPYESRRIEPVSGADGIGGVKIYVGAAGYSIRESAKANIEWITNFQERMKRIDPNQ